MTQGVGPQFKPQYWKKKKKKKKWVTPHKHPQVKPYKFYQVFRWFHKNFLHNFCKFFFSLKIPRLYTCVASTRLSSKLKKKKILKMRLEVWFKW
jgi:hypothetical protein